MRVPTDVGKAIVYDAAAEEETETETPIVNEIEKQQSLKQPRL